MNQSGHPEPQPTKCQSTIPTLLGKKNRGRNFLAYFPEGPRKKCLNFEEDEPLPLASR